MNLPRNEMAFRKEYEQFVLDGSLTTVFRPGNRIYPVWRGYKKDEIIVARIIEKVGDDSKKKPPVFNDMKRPILITKIECKKIEKLTPEDFIGSTLDVLTSQDLKKHLAWIYKKPKSSFHTVTIISFKYLPRSCPVSQTASVNNKLCPYIYA